MRFREKIRKILVPHPKPQLCPQLANVASCGWRRGDDRSMWGHPSANHNSRHEQVVGKVMVLGVTLEFLKK